MNFRIQIQWSVKMEKIIKEAKNGNREAVLHLYEKNKKRIYFICDFLMENEEQTDFVFEDVFEQVWKNLAQKNIQSEEEFKDLCIHIAIKLCKNKYFISNPHQLKEQKPDIKETIEIKEMESNLDFNKICSSLQSLNKETRFVLKSYLCSDFSCRQLKETLNVDEMIIEDYIQYCFQTIDECTQFKSVILKQEKEPFQSTNQKCIETIEALTKKESGFKKIFIVPILLVCLIASYFVLKDDSVYYADINIKDYGQIVVQLDSKQAPETVDNFVSLAQSGFYDGLTFHRIMDGFMMQGGDPNGDGTGGSSQTIKGEFSANGVDNEISHIRGTISMARSSDYNSASSQFFIVQSDSTFLDGQYAAFGTVLSGMDIVDEICEKANPVDDNGSIEKSEQPVIESIQIRKE